MGASAISRSPRDLQKVMASATLRRLPYPATVTALVDFQVAVVFRVKESTESTKPERQVWVYHRTGKPSIFWADQFLPVVLFSIHGCLTWRSQNCRMVSTSSGKQRWPLTPVIPEGLHPLNSASELESQKWLISAWRIIFQTLLFVCFLVSKIPAASYSSRAWIVGCCLIQEKQRHWWAERFLRFPPV